MEVSIRPVNEATARHWRDMRRELGPEWLVDDFDPLVREYLDTGRVQGLPQVVLLALDANDRPLGFAEASLRQYAEGCLTTPVGYLEGWFVAPHARRLGVGRLLVEACERWAAEQGCTEFASDAELTNSRSLEAHARLGFQAVADIRCFRKPISR